MVAMRIGFGEIWEPVLNLASSHPNIIKDSLEEFNIYVYFCRFKPIILYYKFFIYILIDHLTYTNAELKRYLLI
jgi:hypothetical protein